MLLALDGEKLVVDVGFVLVAHFPLADVETDMREGAD